MSDDSINPYAAYTVHEPLDIPQTNGIFQQGKWLIVHKQAVLPNRCVKSNEPTSDRLRRKLMWHPPLIYLLILLHVLIYVIVALIVRKTATFDVPLAKRYKTARIKWAVTAWSIFLVSLGLFILGLATVDRGGALSVISLVQFPFGILIPALIGIYGCRMVYAKKIDDQYAWIGGTCDEFRNSFPEWKSI